MNPEQPQFNPEEKDDRLITDRRERDIMGLEVARQMIEKRMARGEPDKILPLARVNLDIEIDLRNRLLRERDEFVRRDLEIALEKHLRQAEPVMREYLYYEEKAESADLQELLENTNSPDFAERLHEFCDFYYGRDWLPVKPAVKMYKKLGKRADIKPFIEQDIIDMSDELSEHGLKSDQIKELLAWLKER